MKTVFLPNSEERAGDVHVERLRTAFTLVEVLVVISIIGILITILSATVTTSVRKAREAATVALLQKIDKLLEDRIQGFERATASRDFQRIVNTRKQSLEAAGIFGVSPKVIAAIERKDYFRQLFPQRYQDFAPDVVASGPLAGVPTRILTDPMLIPEDANVNGILDAGEDTNGNGVLDGYIHFNHKRETESAALLYFMLTKMQVFGAPAVGESEFATSEVRDTDGDGLLEFVDGWERPLRFYRWPTRLLKPNGPYGADGAPGNGGSSFLAYGTLGTDDVALALAPRDMRPIAGLLISGLAPKPAFPTKQWDPLSEDPDDPYSLVSTEMKRLTASGIPITNLYRYPYTEAFYPTLDTYHVPLVVSVGSDGDLGLFEPYQAGVDSNGDGILEDCGVLAQPIHGPAGAYDITDSVYTPNGNRVTSALADNLTNRNRRAGRGK